MYTVPQQRACKCT